MTPAFSLGAGFLLLSIFNRDMVFADSVFASFKHPSQQTKAVWPSMLNLIGTPMEPSFEFSWLTHSSCSSANFLSAGDSFARFAAMVASSSSGVEGRIAALLDPLPPK